MTRERALGHAGPSPDETAMPWSRYESFPRAMRGGWMLGPRPLPSIPYTSLLQEQPLPSSHAGWHPGAPDQRWLRGRGVCVRQLRQLRSHAPGAGGAESAAALCQLRYGARRPGPGRRRLDFDAADVGFPIYNARTR
jgi:hypothetical protein